MVETNIKIVNFGPKLYFDTRYAQITTQDDLPDLPQRACSRLRTQMELASIPILGGKELLVATQKPIPSLKLQDDDWQLEIKDDQKSRRLHFEKLEDIPLLTQLLERCLLIKVENHTKLWALGRDSLRIWYEESPFKISGDIAAYNRFEISSISIESVGVGLVVDIGTAFFTALNVADFFQNGMSKEFNLLSQRQKGQKGTLLYNLDKIKRKCYFDSFCPDITCSTTGKMQIQGKSYNSLLDYYKQKYPYLQVDADELVARVSFKGLDRPQYVSAKRLYIRVMNESLPGELKQVDKIEPKERCELIEEFWKLLGDKPLGGDQPGVEPGFWHPDEQVIHIKPPNLMFPEGQVVPAPQNGNLKECQNYYRQRLSLLNKLGCVEVPPTIKRNIYFRVPVKLGDTVANKLADDITACLSKWTRKQIIPDVKTYEDLSSELNLVCQEREPSIAVFVFEDEDPATYFTISNELKSWRVKRITYNELESNYNKLQFVENSKTVDYKKAERIKRNWQSFIDMNALDVLQLMDCIPWKLEDNLHYEAHLAIDVSEDRKYFALSLFICRPIAYKPSFRFNTLVETKADTNHETINEIILCDKIVDIFKQVGCQNFNPLQSILVLRDGRDCGRELEGINNAKEKLIQMGFLDKDAQMDLVDIYKHTNKGIRLLDISHEGFVQNVLEGTAILLDNKTIIIANTGLATLHQGTTDPIRIVTRQDGIDMVKVAEDVFSATQFNWSSPGIAQRLPIVLKRTDDQLEKRMAQEIRRIY